MTLIQTLLVTFFLYVLFKVVRRYQAGEMALGITALWALFWLGAIFVAVVPTSTSKIAEFVGVGRGADLAVYISLALLFFIVFRLMARIDKLNKEITTVTRELALHKEKISSNE